MRASLRISILLTLLAATGIAFWACRLRASDLEDSSMVNAPDFPAGFAWLNTDRPLQFKATPKQLADGSAASLRGQVVLLDFWTYCCINCMHVIPDLEYLENKFKDQPFTVIGVHSAKFDNEGQTANVRSAIQRYLVHHPVVVDQESTIWDQYAVRSWPTLILIGSDGRVIGQVSGEGHRELLEQVVQKALDDGRKAGTLASSPLKLQHEGIVQSATGLAFPGKVVADAVGRRLFIVDSNHHRIVMTTWPDSAGRVKSLGVIGSGQKGQADGDFATAQFNRPQGAAVAGETLFVSDTENHLIRRVDLKNKVVTTVLGTGQMAFDPEGGKSGRAQALNSPWDVAVSGTKLYFSMAGQHQIWVANTLTWMAEPLAGTARENIADGPAREANLAQPSGLALDVAHDRLYFADSEVSAVRYIDLKANEVHTLVGRGLFDFGDRDGAAKMARFQHPLGVALWNDEVLVADTYNHKIRAIDQAADTVSTLLGTGKPASGTPGSALGLYEPASIAVTDAGWLIADTNNHRIVLVDPATKSWRQLMIDGLDGTAQKKAPVQALAGGTVTLAAGQPATIALSPRLDLLTHLTAGAPVSVKIVLESPDGDTTISQQTLTGAEHLPLTAELSADQVKAGLTGAAAANWLVRLDYTFCKDGPGAVCMPRTVTWRVGVKSGGSSSPITLVEPDSK